MGNTTGTFDHDGELRPEGGQTDLSSSLGGDRVELKYPKFDFSYARRIAEGIGEEASIGGTQQVYSASFDTEVSKQDYDLQKIIESSTDHSGSVGGKKILIKFFMTRERGLS
mgnify:CR=1 FL=1